MDTPARLWQRLARRRWGRPDRASEAAAPAPGARPAPPKPVQGQGRRAVCTGAGSAGHARLTASRRALAGPHAYTASGPPAGEPRLGPRPHALPDHRAHVIGPWLGGCSPAGEATRAPEGRAAARRRATRRRGRGRLPGRAHARPGAATARHRGAAPSAKPAQARRDKCHRGRGRAPAPRPSAWPGLRCRCTPARRGRASTAGSRAAALVWPCRGCARAPLECQPCPSRQCLAACAVPMPCGLAPPPPRDGMAG